MSQTVCSAAETGSPAIMPYARDITSWPCSPPQVTLCQLPTSKHLRVLQQPWERMWRHSGTLERETSWERHPWGDEGFPALLPPKLCHPLPGLNVPLAREWRGRQGLTVLSLASWKSQDWYINPGTRNSPLGQGRACFHISPQLNIPSDFFALISFSFSFLSYFICAAVLLFEPMKSKHVQDKIDLSILEHIQGDERFEICFRGVHYRTWLLCQGAMQFQWFQPPKLEKNSLFFFSLRAVELKYILQNCR